MWRLAYGTQCERKSRLGRMAYGTECERKSRLGHPPWDRSVRGSVGGAPGPKVLSLRWRAGWRARPMGRSVRGRVKVGHQAPRD